MYNIITALNNRRYRYVVKKQNKRNNKVYRKSTFLNVFIKNMIHKAAPEPEPAPVQVAAPVPEPEPVQVAAPEPEPEPVQVAAPEPEPEPVQVAAPVPEPEPAPPVPPKPSPPVPAKPSPAQEYEEFMEKRKKRMQMIKQMMSL